MRKMLKPEKKTYEAPRLVSYGNATVLVKSGGSPLYDGSCTRRNHNC